MILRPHPGVIETPVGSRVVLYHRENRTATVLNPAGSEMWRRLGDGTDSIEGLVNQLAVQYQQDRSTMTADVTAFVDDLRVKGLLAEDD